ncbi:AsmA protein [Methylophilus rhizosphaerae]|uniref:AsmA protein n=1 Tax=Methylophilus rhizosphaerae TaxID=492660 RepID=A0A1G9EE94_9PROT|nr:AsmA family protein [Methylophilus rhizosphaerae]SDK74403.1 AsmA protein [Methylophilus rhizosphaerae]
MNNTLKKILYIVGAIIGVLLLLVIYLAATFNPNDYKSTVIQLVKDKKQRTLDIKGDIKLSFWPKIGADLGEISLSEHQSDKQFAAIKSAKVALAVLPLLKKEIVVDTVYLDGAQVNVIQHADGSFNFDDLMSKEDDSESQQINFDVQGIKITNTQAGFLNEASGAKYSVDQLNLTTGQVALKQPFDVATDFHVAANQPAMDANASIKANVMADPEGKHFVVKDLDAQLKGALLDGKDVTLSAQGSVDVDAAKTALNLAGLKVAMQGNFAGTDRNVTLEAPALAVNPEQISSDKVLLALKQKAANGDDVTVEVALAEIKGNQQAVESKGITADVQLNAGARKVEGHFASPVKANLADMIFDVPGLAGKFDIKDPALPNGAMQGQFKLSANANVKQEQAKSTFDLTLAETRLNGDVSVAGFKTPHIGFKVHADTLNLNALLGNSKQKAPATSTAKADTKPDKPAELSALKTLFLDGSINIGKILYSPYTLTGLNVAIKADGQKLALQGLDVKLDDTRIQGNVGISQFSKPLYTFDLNIDKLDLNRYLPQQTAAAESKPAGNAPDSHSEEQPLDLSPLKALNAQGNIRVGWLKYGKTEAKNLNIGLKSQDGLASLDPLNVDVYQGTVRGAVKVDARATPSIAINQNLQNIAVGPLLMDTINNDMLSGNGNLKLDVTAQGNTVTALKKSLGGLVDLRMADGAVKGIDIAGTIRDAKSKLNVLKGQSDTAADQSKKTDFSELTASFNIKNGVAHNEDLAMKAPVFRLTKGESKGDIDIGKEQINYVAKPTLVNSLKGQGGKESDELSGIGIPIKITGTFAAPKFGIDMAALGQALAKSAALDALTDKIGGDKAGAVKSLIGGDNKADALKGLLNGKSSGSSTDDTKSDAAKQESGSNTETKPAQKALKKLLKF